MLYNISLDQGSTFEKEIVYKDSSENPIDLTGYTARMQVREKYESSTYLVELSTTNSKIVIDPLLGKILLKLSDSETALLKSGNHRYDLELVSADGKVLKLLKGQFTVYPEVTR